MDAGLLIQLISGLIGGTFAGLILKDRSLGTVGNSLSGLVGGGLGGQILVSLLGPGTAGAGGPDIVAIFAQILGGGLGGAVLTAVVALLKQNFAK
jgi:uncharacterized membrane protein YeaQ/YmgE (transglycosylase-associated protein family)